MFGRAKAAKGSGVLNDYVLKTCRRCKGKGTADVGWGLCSVCNGAGKVYVARPGYKCPICKGTGLSQISNASCEACGGSGWSYTRYGMNA